MQNPADPTPAPPHRNPTFTHMFALPARQPLHPPPRQLPAPASFLFAPERLTSLLNPTAATRMFANLIQLLTRRPPEGYDHAFVEDVHVHRRAGRNRRSEALLLLGWLLIGLKTWATFWFVDTYHMPFNAWWIVLPTLFAAAVCTWIYWRR